MRNRARNDDRSTPPILVSSARARQSAIDGQAPSPPSHALTDRPSAIFDRLSQLSAW
jgi:hypothetical protein